MTERDQPEDRDYPDGSVGRYVREKWGSAPARPARAARPYVPPVEPPSPRPAPDVESDHVEADSDEMWAYQHDWPHRPDAPEARREAAEADHTRIDPARAASSHDPFEGVEYGSATWAAARAEEERAANDDAARSERGAKTSPVSATPPPGLGRGRPGRGVESDRRRSGGAGRPGGRCRRRGPRRPARLREACSSRPPAPRPQRRREPRTAAPQAPQRREPVGIPPRPPRRRRPGDRVPRRAAPSAAPTTRRRAQGHAETTAAPTTRRAPAPRQRRPQRSRLRGPAPATTAPTTADGRRAAPRLPRPADPMTDTGLAPRLPRQRGPRSAPPRLPRHR